MKALKLIGKVLLWIVVLVVLLVLTLPLWLGPVVKPIANATVPKFTKTSFNLGHLFLNPYTGRFELGDMRLGNPAGYDEPTAAAVDKLVFDVSMKTLGDKCVHVEEITIDGVFVSLVKGGEYNVDNMTQIQYNVAGGKEKYEAGKAKAELEKEGAEEPKPEAEDAEAEDSGKRVVIDVLTIRNVRVKYGMLTIPVPSITLRNLGKESDGLTLGELGETIWESIINAALAVGDGAKALGGIIKSGADAFSEGVSTTAVSVRENVGATAETVSDSATKTVGAIGDSVGAAAGAVGQGAGKAVDAVSGGVRAVGNSVEAAAGAIKGLFKKK